jgi:hypothetical protein
VARARKRPFYRSEERRCSAYGWGVPGRHQEREGHDPVQSGINLVALLAVVGLMLGVAVLILLVLLYEPFVIG